MKLWMITGNATDDGAPIYLQANGRWTTKQTAGRPLTNESERDAMLEFSRTQQRVVCDPYAITVERGPLGHLLPTSLRERIRAQGPTIAPPTFGAATSKLPTAIGA